LNKFAYIYFNSTSAALIDKRHRADWVMYSTLKNYLGKKNWIHHSDIQKLSENVPYTFHTLRVRLPRLVANGYAVRTKKGYVLLGIKKVAAAKFNTKLNFRYTYVVGETKKELVARVSMLCFRDCSRKQVYSSLKKENKVVTQSQKSRYSFSNGEKPTASVRWVAKSIGYSSASTGSKLEKLWEDFGLAEIKRSNSYLCHVRDYHAQCMADPTLHAKTFVVGSSIFVRNINLIVMK